VAGLLMDKAEAARPDHDAHTRTRPSSAGHCHGRQVPEACRRPLARLAFWLATGI